MRRWINSLGCFFVALSLIYVSAIDSGISTKAKAQLSMVGVGPASTAASSLDPATVAWVACVTGAGGTASAGRQTIVNTLITSLKSSSIWTPIDRLWLFAAENTQSALCDLKVPATATAVSAPTFTVDRGYTGDGIASYVTSNYTPSLNGVSYTQNSAHICAWSVTAAAASAEDRIIGVGPASTVRNLLVPRFTGDVTFYMVNDGTGTSLANANSSGFFLANRSAAGATQAYRNGASLGSGANASTGVSDKDIRFDQDSGSGSHFGTLQFAVGCAGGSFSATDVTNYYNALRTWATAIGIP